MLFISLNCESRLAFDHLTFDASFSIFSSPSSQKESASPKVGITLGLESAMPEAISATLRPQTSLNTISPSPHATAAAGGNALRDDAARDTIRVTGIRSAMKQQCIPYTVLSGDRLLCRLAALRDSIAVPMARAAFAITQREAWIACGFKNDYDFARERLDRDQRWLYDLVRLHETLEAHPAVASALCGMDGGPHLGQMAAIQIGRVATPSNVDAWIDRARHLSFVELRAAVAQHLVHGK